MCCTSDLGIEAETGSTSPSVLSAAVLKSAFRWMSRPPSMGVARALRAERGRLAVVGNDRGRSAVARTPVIARCIPTSTRTAGMKRKMKVD